MAKKLDLAKLGWIEWFVIEYRWVLILLFMLPMTVCYDLYFYLRDKVLMLMRKFDTTTHNAKVAAISKEIQDWIKEGSTTMLCTARPAWQAMSLRQGKYKKTYKNINVNLHTIIGIDEKAMTVRVEPMCTMGQVLILMCSGHTQHQLVPEKQA